MTKANIEAIVLKRAKAGGVLMTKASSSKPILLLTRFENLKSVITGIAFLVVVSFFIIGGCNNDSGSAPSGEARTIDQIEGVIVPAIKAEYSLQMWREGDPDGDIFLNGSRVADLTQPEIDALNSAYQSGFFVSLIEPETQDMNDLLEVLGLQPLIEDNRPVDLYAVSREFNVSGVRHFTIDTLDDVNEDSPPGLRFHRDRVDRLIAWAADESTVTTQMREDSSPTSELTQLADSHSYTKVYSFPSGLEVIKIDDKFTGSSSDYFLHSTTTLQGWSVHSEADNSDFYFFQVQYEFAPNTTLQRVQPGNLWPCQVQQPPIDFSPLFPRNLDLRGNRNIFTTNIVTDFNSDNVQNLDSEPKTTVGTSSTSSTLSKMVGGNVSYSTEDGAGVGLSESVSYDQTQSYSAPAVQIDNESLDGPGGNNATWNYDITNPNTVFGVATNTFQPVGQWELNADSSTREGGLFNITTGFRLEVILITCATNPGVQYDIPDPNIGSGLIGWSLNFPVPPLPPPPAKTCTTTSDCSTGEVCATDKTPPVCEPQPCDEMMTCPSGFDCMNDVCQPSGG